MSQNPYARLSSTYPSSYCTSRTGKLDVSASAGVETLRHATLTSTSISVTSNLVHLSVKLSATLLQALLDSGATLNFVNETIVKNLALKTTPCAPTKVTLADGRVLTHATRQTTLHYYIANVPQEDTFLVAPMGDHSIILGMPWLERVNPQIDWPTKTVDFSSSPTQNKHSITTEEPIVPIPKPTPKPLNPTKTVDFSSLSTQDKHRPLMGLTTRICPDDQVFLAIYHPTRHSLSTLSNTEPTNERPKTPVKLPPEYNDFADVFSENNANKLPPLRGHLDHSISLEEGTKPQFGPIYNLSEIELEVLKEYIETHLANGFIRPSSSPFGAPVLFVKKPHGRGLRLVVDYRALNRVTIKNRYPLPLISELLDRLRKAKLFTKIDLRAAYNLIRIARGEEWKTAFRTRYGHFEYLVMPFGLTNAPATFQSYINSALREYLDNFCTAYLDDILIYSNSREKHTEHVRLVLTKLQKHGLYASLEKCEFSVQEVNFLGYIISPKGVAMEPNRITTIVEWPTPNSVHDIQVFLGFCNFYRRFIKAYSRVALPITTLLQKSPKEFQWTPTAQRSFEQLKLLFTQAPILRHFDPELPIFLYNDASGFATSAILCQPHDENVHPVAFWSRKSTPAECNYDIHDRELLAIVSAFQHWRHYLEGAKHTVTVYTDHKNLEVFMNTKILNRRQARWAELLAGYDFVLTAIPGSRNPADGPSRRPDYAKDVIAPDGLLIPPFAFPTSSKIMDAPLFLLSAALNTFTPETPLRQRFLEALRKDPIAISQQTPTSPYSWHDGLLCYKTTIYIPETLRLDVLRMHHDDPLAGHFGIAKTIELLSRNYWFPKLSAYVKNYVSTCDLCSRSKHSRHMKYGELLPLPVPSKPWKGITCDFIVDLPPSNGYDALLVFVDRLTKMIHLIPCNKASDAPQFARMFLDHIVRLHGLPESIVSDRGAIFTSHFWKTLTKLLNINGRLSTSFHPQTDGQTERINQIAEQYLRMYCNYQQDDWYYHLSLAEFAYNNAYQSSIQCSPFYANYGFHPEFHVNLQHNEATNIPAAKEYAEQLAQHHERLVENVKQAQNSQAQYYDAKHKRIEFAVKDKVWLLSSNIRTERPSKKLDWKRLGPFTITERIGLQAYRLNLPQSMKIHPVFHISLLEPYKPSTIPGRFQDPPPPVVINDEYEWEVEHILDSIFRHGKLWYKVHWRGYSTSEDSWQPASNLANSLDLIKQFHSRYPSKPGSVPPIPNTR